MENMLILYDYLPVPADAPVELEIVEARNTLVFALTRFVLSFFVSSTPSGISRDAGEPSRTRALLAGKGSGGESASKDLPGISFLDT
ncbi:MAG: hypothetical protein KAU38_11390, partial [Desulfobacterales bacterium]|nr:hypothetical protein [Desulfobacterales bacterium]